MRNSAIPRVDIDRGPASPPILRQSPIGSDKPLAPRNRLTWKVAGLSLAAFLVAAVLFLWIYRLDLLRLTATRLLDRSGLGPVELTVSRFDLFGLQAHDISLYGGAIRVAELTLAYEPLRLAAGVVDQAKIVNLQVTMAVAGSDITVGGAPLRIATSSDGVSPIGRFRIDAIKIVEAHIELDSPTGRLEATFSTDLALSGADIRNTSFAVDLTVPVAGTVHTMHIVAPELALSPQDGGGLRLLFDKVTILPKDIPWTVDDLGGEILWQADRLLAKVGSSRLSNTQNPAFVVPLRLTGNATMVGSQTDFAMHVVADALGTKGKINLDATGGHDRSSGHGRLSITTAPVLVQANGVQPHDFFPAIGDALPKLTGSAALSGSVTWRDAALSPALILRLADVAYEPEGARLSKIHGDIKFAGLWPLATAPGQVLNGTVEAGGLRPTNATLIFQLLPKPALSVEGLRMDFVGGQMSASPFIIDPARPDLDTVIAFRQVDLAEFFKLVSVDGLSGSGHLDGHIPLKLARGKIVIRDGQLAASGPGVLQLRSDVLPKQITDAGASMTLALRALADFHYDTLVIDLAGNPTGNGTIALRLQGHNPAVLDGRAFNLNIKLESNFDRLVDLTLRSMAAARELLRRTTGSMRQ